MEKIGHVSRQSTRKKIEFCIKQSHVNYSVVSQKNKGIGEILDANGGVACFTGHDSFLSQVVGWGFNSLAANYDQEIDQLEAFYRKKNTPIVILNFHL